MCKEVERYMIRVDKNEVIENLEEELIISRKKWRSKKPKITKFNNGDIFSQLLVPNVSTPKLKLCLIKFPVCFQP